MTETRITPQIIAQHGLTEEEYQKIEKILGREPSFTELGIFSVMWSEHCSYKTSKPILDRFPTKAPWVLQGPGENAGIVDIGEGLAVVMKVESHNHPSAIEPYQGAATGVGGILRDIFTMGARPIALLNSLRFGDLREARTRYLFEHIVSGIADYGNCMGVPTVGGEVYFEDCYRDNPLVNAMCVGIIKHENIVKGSASGVGNPVIYVGSTTGLDGIHGATFASEELSEASAAKRPNVQIGDPFTEKLLLEASLELIKKGLLTGIQDMGAAGLTSSSSEMASRAGNGITLNLEKVPRREAGMTPYEIMLSESQERMLVVGKAGCEREIEAIFRKWDLQFAVIGEVTDDGVLRIKEGDRIYAEIPAEALTDGAPQYRQVSQVPAYLEELHHFDPEQIPQPADYNKVLIDLLTSPSIASKEWVYEQYDHLVRTDTVVLPGSDAAVLRIKDSELGIALTIDGNARYLYLDPGTGGKSIICEAARNLAVSGARPLAVTDCLNFGNPLKPEVFYQFERAVDGLSEACEALRTPVISGNVSFYNESANEAIYPTPTIGMVGVLADVSKAVTAWFRQAGDLVYLLGRPDCHLGGSEYLKTIHGKVAGAPPPVDLTSELKLIETLLLLADKRILNSAHDLSDGGLAVALAESCVMNKNNILGAEI